MNCEERTTSYIDINTCGIIWLDFCVFSNKSVQSSASFEMRNPSV